MLERFADSVASHRILLSRIFAIALFALLVVSRSAHDGTLLEGLLFSVALVLVGVATVGRLWCAMYISGYKNSELITSGPYSMTRNPMYFFSFLGFAGIGFATETLTCSLTFPLVFLLAYPSIIKREEEFLRSTFGPSFMDYCARTPRFFPTLKTFHEEESYVVNARLFRRAMFDALWFIWLVGIIEFVETLHDSHILTPVVWLP